METFEDGPLRLELTETDTELTVTWRGRSMAREPGLFLLPILTRTVEDSERKRKRVIFDFRFLEYLNSSTITPVIRILEQAKRGSTSLSVIYSADAKWQALSFSALYLFQSLDGRVIVGAK
ncbi:MAG TPA: hypothetical protein VJ787_09920 [Thermoleophilia bacterium]|nr:hypothetical protein [Thermoleophilia bacterium]